MRVEDQEKLNAFIQEYRDDPGGLIPVLQKTQRQFGHISEEAMRVISKGLGKPLANVYGVATFYAQFSLEAKGEHKVGVCMGTACYVRGADKCLEKCKELLGVDAGKTSEDGQFSLEITRCVGACGLAPVVMVDEDVYGSVTPVGVPDILKKYKGAAR